MEGCQHVILEGILQGNLKGNNVVEQGEDVIAIGSVRRCRHTQIERRIKVLHDPLIAARSRTMGLVHHNVIECRGVKLFQVANDCRTHSKQAGRTSSTLISAGLIGAVRISIAQ